MTAAAGHLPMVLARAKPLVFDQYLTEFDAACGAGYMPAVPAVVRDAALAKRGRTKDGPSDNRPSENRRQMT
jgi:hypothetical protein